MEKDKIKPIIQKLISENKVCEALENLANYVRNNDRYSENDVLLQMAFFNRNQKDYQNNLISNSDYNTAIAKIINAIVYILEKMPAEGNDLALVETEKEGIRKILFLTANPKNTSSLRLEEEFKKVKDELSKTTARDSFQLFYESSVNIKTITSAMQKHKPEIVHFSGHGTGKNGIVVEDEIGNIVLFPTSGLEKMFKLFDQVKCVLLNACYSKEQAQMISKHGIYVIGMNDTIEDEAAIDFAVGFYQSLGEGNKYDFAYEIAMVNISPSLANSDIPEIWFNGEKVYS